MRDNNQAEETKYTRPEFHRRLAAELFNLVWEFLDKPDRTMAESDQMVHAAHASRYHWSQVGTALNLARGEWQVSRVYSVLNRPQPALYHAQRCLEICQENKIGDFDLAFAYEALARASSVAGLKQECQHYLKLGQQCGEQIKEKEGRDLFFSDLKTIPG